MIRIAYYGRPGSFSEEGAIACFPQRNVQFIPCGKFIEVVFSNVIEEKADFGVVPVENSSHGIINETYDSLLEEQAYIVGESILRIRQHFLVNRGTTINQIKNLYSHSAAITQCKKFLKEHPDWEVETLGDTATCAEKIKKERLMNAGAIANKRAAEVYDLEILQENIHDSEDNFTKFFIINKKIFEGEGDKTSIAFGLRNGLNSLRDYMNFFVERKIRIIKIESRPAKSKPFEYNLYMDFLGDPRKGKARDAMSDLQLATDWCKFLGTYKSATFPP